MRSAAIIEWEVHKEKGLIHPGPEMRVVMSPRQWAVVTSCVQATAGTLARLSALEKSPQVLARLLDGLRELLDILRALERR